MAGHAAKRARVDSGRQCSTSGPGPGARLEAELEGSLREFVRLRTVSSDPTLREECFRGAKYLATLLESLGTAPDGRLSALQAVLRCYVLDRSAATGMKQDWKHNKM